jgi:hypothetical protein
MYIQHKTKTAEDGTAPEFNETAGRARIPAPTVVPHTNVTAAATEPSFLTGSPLSALSLSSSGYCTLLKKHALVLGAACFSLVSRELEVSLNK